MRDLLHHLFIPRESNNHRAKLLHHTGLLFLVGLLFTLQALFSTVHTQRQDILGVRTDITSSDLLTLTNKRRDEAGLAPLTLDQTLSNAASQKATDMFARNYWAHNGPDGTTPWVFIKSSGYDYLYAGENLARGFSTSPDIVQAWMDSPGHRENMLSSNYTDIGFAVVPGTLTGDETVLVVEMFGKKRADSSDIATSQGGGDTVPLPKTNLNESVPPTTESKPKQEPAVASFQTQPLLDMKQMTKGVSLVIVSVLLFTILFDLIIIERKKIIRVVGHNIDTMLFLFAILVTVIVVGNGIVI